MGSSLLTQSPGTRLRYASWYTVYIIHIHCALNSYFFTAAAFRRSIACFCFANRIFFIIRSSLA
jgi:hypothetical protein